MSRKQSAVDHVNSIPSHLHHPLLGGVLSDTGERHAACLQVQEEEYVISCQSAPGEHFDGEEIDPSQNRGPVQERAAYLRDRPGLVLGLRTHNQGGEVAAFIRPTNRTTIHGSCRSST